MSENSESNTTPPRPAPEIKKKMRKDDRLIIPLPDAVTANLFQQYHAFLWCYLFPSAVNLPGIKKYNYRITKSSGKRRTIRQSQKENQV